LQDKKRERETIFEEDDLLYSKLLGDFYKAWSPQIESLANELNSPNEQTHKTIHTLKGVSGNLALEELYESCVLIDAAFKQKKQITKEQVENFKSTFSKTLQSISLKAQKSLEVQPINVDLKEAKGYYEELMDYLDSYDLISYESQSKYMAVFKPYVPNDSLQRWQKAIERLDYDSAKAIMESWDFRSKNDME